MSLKTRMAERQTANSAKAAVRENLYKSERAYRLDKRVDTWASIPEIGAGLKNLDETTARNVACNLDNQAAHMSRMTETQMSQGFKGFTPENMLRLVRLAMPNVVRNKIFTEFAMETARDSIKYVRPVYSKPVKGGSMADKADDFNRLYDDDVADNFNDVNSKDYRKAIYESTEDRISQELATVPGVYTETEGEVLGNTKFTFKTLPASSGADAAETALYKATAKFGDNGEKYLDGYGVVYYEKETNVIAIQDKRTKDFMLAPEAAGLLKVNYTAPTSSAAAFIEVVPADGASDKADKAEIFGVKLSELEFAKIKAFARYDSEDDFEGDYLGEMQIIMSDYEFRPRPTTIGVTWSQLSEIVLDTSFSVSAEEYLVTYASQAIRMHLDYRAIKIAYQQARTNPAAYHIEFDAAYNTINDGGNPGTKEGYIENAQTFLSAISTIGDVMLNDINRGGVTKLVCGPSAGTYMQLMAAYSTKGSTQNEGAHQIGELDGRAVYKVPQSIIPTNEVLTVWKNPANEADISVAFGTLVPFFSTGIIQRKNFYKEAGLSTYGDHAIINKRYFALITINNLKDSTK